MYKRVVIYTHVKSRLIEKDPDAETDWERVETEMTEDQMVGWHHRFNEHEFEQTLEDSEGQGKSGMLQSIGLQRVKHDIVTE